MNTQEHPVVQTDPDADLPEDIRRIPPEHRTAELARLAAHPTALEQQQHQVEVRTQAQEYGIPYP